jgi:hypothetical protein
MKARTKHTILYVFTVLLLTSACLGTSLVSGGSATRVSPSVPPTAEPIVTREPTASLTVAAGSFDDFRLFAAKIDTALQDRKASFFDDHAASSTWHCLGDETMGICKDAPADTTLEGIPVSYDWATYEVYSREDYRETWQARFDQHSILKLVAIAQRYGENPLMPMAGESFFAIVSIADDGGPSSVQEVRILFFEYDENAWHMRGEFVTIGYMDSWLRDSCSTCYDMWAAWQD